MSCIEHRNTLRTITYGPGQLFDTVIVETGTEKTEELWSQSHLSVVHYEHKLIVNYWAQYLFNFGPL